MVEVYISKTLWIRVGHSLNCKYFNLVNASICSIHGLLLDEFQSHIISITRFVQLSVSIFGQPVNHFVSIKVEHLNKLSISNDITLHFATKGCPCMKLMGPLVFFGGLWLIFEGHQGIYVDMNC